MPLLQFTPIPSRPSPSFFSTLTNLKLDELKLDDSEMEIVGYLEEGRSVIDREGKSGDGSGQGDGQVWIGGCLVVDGSSLDQFGEGGTQSSHSAIHFPFLRTISPSAANSSSSISISGTFRNFNTIEEFRKQEVKKRMFNTVAESIYSSWSSSSAIVPKFNHFLLLSFSDLKKYTYTYQFGAPVIVQKGAWEIGLGDGSLTESRAIAEREDLATADAPSPDEMRVWKGDVLALRRAKQEAGLSGEAFLVKSTKAAGAEQEVYEVGTVNEWSAFFEGVPENECTLVFHDPSTLATAPGWTLRNILHYLSLIHRVSSLRVIALRSGPLGSTRIFGCHLKEMPEKLESSKEGGAEEEDVTEDLKVVGWERNGKGLILPKVADLGATMDPRRLADQAVDLNLKLMRWRVMPNLNLEKIAETKCLLLGAGTLGCYVARCLMGWGIRNITFVDSAKVSYSNPVRQPLFEFEDCLSGGKPKAQCAADSLKRIFPGINATGVDLKIPMPGHPIAPSSESAVKNDVHQLEQLMSSHDAIFLLMDSRESRWLPTVIGTAMGKIVINAALGFDSWLVMRHGVPVAEEPSVGAAENKLGCYYCNDVVAPADSLTDRSLDQMCTVTRPGIAPIAAATAVELLVSLLQHPQGVHAPADLASSPQAAPSAEPASILGLVPHQLRGFLSQFRTMLIEGASYDKCTGCSATVLEAYRSQGFEMLLHAFNEGDYLEKLTGLDKVHEEGEAAMEAIDWDEASDGSGSGSGSL